MVLDMRTRTLVAASVATLVAGVVVFKLFAMRQKARRKADAERGGKAAATEARQATAEADADHGECCLCTANSFLLVLGKMECDRLVYLAENFCGRVITRDQVRNVRLEGATVFVCGDLSANGLGLGLGLEAAKRVLVIGELSQGHEGGAWPTVDVGRVPILVHGVGVLYRRLFDTRDLFARIQAAHTFQTLTESTKPGTAHRKGVYLTPVVERGEGVHFRLLRCSSNFSGPTLNFGDCDRAICDTLNEEAAGLFEGGATLNHVLAQIYTNTAATATAKQTKAKIKARRAHADKTKDMPRNGLMAFCTFYDGLEKLERMGEFDYGHKGVSGLTRLRFRLKAGAAKSEAGRGLSPQFSVTLYPNSAFFMPLSTNRLYTHEVRPPPLDAQLLPTRMGYVVRCSDCEAVHTDGRTMVRAGSRGALVPLEPPTPEGMEALRKLYAEENATDAVIDYCEHGPLLFSMNGGDYEKPLVCEGGQAAGGRQQGEFRSFVLPTDDSPFEPLMSSVHFEDVGKGRRGTVLVRPDAARGVPIVRTTSKYAQAAQCFGPLHERLASDVEACASLPPGGFNNALIECYTSGYTKMGFHSDQARVTRPPRDRPVASTRQPCSRHVAAMQPPCYRHGSPHQALDLQEGSTIALFSCYRHPERVSAPRTLVVEEKERGGAVAGTRQSHGGQEVERAGPSSPAAQRTFAIPLVHNSVVVFGLDANRRFRHKIVLRGDTTPPKGDAVKAGTAKKQKQKQSAAAAAPVAATAAVGGAVVGAATAVAAGGEEPFENEWLGVTFRTSKTFVQVGDGCVRFADGTLLTLADEAQAKEFYALRARENGETGFEYPPLLYTLSESDLMPPTTRHII